MTKRLREGLPPGEKTTRLVFYRFIPGSNLFEGKLNPARHPPTSTRSVATMVGKSSDPEQDISLAWVTTIKPVPGCLGGIIKHIPSFNLNQGQSSGRGK